jgi:CheY-like chemotaxis protein
MNGLDADRELRARMNSVPIILFTWYADAVLPQDATAGISAVVSKSNPAALQTRLNTLFEAA